MATIRMNRGKWQAIVRRVGFPQQSKTFESKVEARRWARCKEFELDTGHAPDNLKILEQTTVADMLLKYQRIVTVNKKGHASESKRIDGFMRLPWVQLRLHQITPQTFSKYRDARLEKVQPSTVRRDLGLLRSIFETAIKEWDIPLKENPLLNVKRPKEGEARNRRLESGELDALMVASDSHRDELLQYCILTAIETGMRRGELLSALWGDLCFKSSTLLIRDTKNGYSRRIPLSKKAVKLLSKFRESVDVIEERIFPTSPNAFQLSWQRCKKRAAAAIPDINDLRFHDLRHEAISRFFELGLNVPEVALISGHRDPRMLFRYTHMRADDLVSKLNRVVA